MRTEIITGVIILLGLFLKYAFNLSFAGPVLVISMSILSLFYFPAGFYFLSDGTLKNQTILMSVFGGMALSAGVMGVLFRVMYWSGSGNMIQSALIFASITLLLSVLLYFKALEKEKGKPDRIEEDTTAKVGSFQIHSYYRKIAGRSLIIVFALLVAGMLPLNTLISFQYRDDPERARLLIRSIENPQNQEYRKEYQEYVNRDYRLRK